MNKRDETTHRPGRSAIAKRSKIQIQTLRKWRRRRRNGPDAPASYAPPLGMNLNHVADWILNGAFTNMFREARMWGGSPTLDASGWPTAGWPAQTVLLNQVGAANIRTGTYTVFYAGAGTITISMSASATITSSGQTFTVTTPAAGGIGVTISSSSAAPNHVRDIAIVHSSDLAAYLAGDTFTAAFRSFVQDACGVIRFMDPFATNGSEHIDWANRAKPTWYTQASSSASGVGSSTRGLCIEFAVELCNLAGKDMWLNVPHRATDDYCQQLFAYVAANLDPARVVWIELSNEVWNALFDRATGDSGPTDNGQHTYFLSLANSLGLGGGGDTEKRQRGYKRRAIEVFDLAATAFGGTSRIRRVLATQRNSHAVADYAMTFESENNSKIDFIAIASYWGNAALNAAQNPSGRKPTTLDEYFADLALARPTAEALDVADIAYFRATYGKEVVAYEGGLVSEIANAGGWSSDAALHALVNAAMADPRMLTEYRTWIANAKLSGYQLLMHYGSIYPHPTTGTAGRWGLREHLYAGDAASQKYVALRNAHAGIG